MSILVLCPDCKRRLNVPETAVDKTIRCPACKALIPPVSEPRSAASDAEDAEPDVPSPSRAVKRAPSLQTASVPSPARPPREEEAEEDIGPSEKPLRKKSSRRERSMGKKSSAGLVIGLAVGGGVLLLLLLGAGGGLLWYFARGKAIAETEWQPFTPPGGDCTVLMPGAPRFQPLTTNGVTVNKYLVERHGEQTVFVVAFANLGFDLFKPNAVELLAHAERDEIVRKMNGKAGSETAIALAGLPGREFQIAPPAGGIFIERIYLAKIGGAHRLYIVAAGYNREINKGDVDRFFASFKIDASAQPPTFDDAARQGGAQPPPAVNPGQANPQPNPSRPPARPRPPRGPRRQR